MAEEFFFRGFFDRALRSRWSILGAAAIDGLLFGVIHYDFTGADALLIFLLLAILGFIFCLVYERTGSIYPTIAMHSFNNAIAFGVTIHNGSVSLVLGPLMLLACATIPRASRRPWHSHRRMTKLLRVSLVLIALAPAVAHAQIPTVPTTPTTPVEPKPAKGKATLSIEGGLATKKTHFYAPSQEVVVRGVVKPYVPERGAHAVRDPRQEVEQDGPPPRG